MLKRSIVISSPARVSLRNSQLIIERNNADMSSVPIEDLSTVIVENQQTSVSIPALNALTAENVSVILCDNIHVPTSYLAPLASNTLQGERYRQQINSGATIKKSTWQQIVKAKIENQSMLLKRLHKDWEALKPYYTNVKSDDSDNREGSAARIYWPLLFGPDFTRLRNGGGPNNLLNFGYTILRAVTIRAIVGVGLLPALGIHHRNRYNAFPLADDLMEPYRPYVDETVYQLWQNGDTKLDRNVKNKLINVSYTDVKLDNKLHPLAIAVSMTCSSWLKVINKKQKNLILPHLI